MSDHQNGQWEKKSKKEIDKAKYRFTGERYSFRGVSGTRISDYVPQIKGLYGFPTEDEENVGGEGDNQDVR